MRITASIKRSAKTCFPGCKTPNMRSISFPTAFHLLAFARGSFGSPLPTQHIGRALATSKPIVLQVPAALRNVFPADNFNRNVTVPCWSTNVFAEQSTDVEVYLDSLAEAHFIVLDNEFYDVLGVDQNDAEKIVEKVFEFPPGYPSRHGMFTMEQYTRQSVTASSLLSCTRQSPGTRLTRCPGSGG